MPSTAFDSAIFRDVFGAPAMRGIFSDEAVAARWVDVEVALDAGIDVPGRLAVADRDHARGKRRHPSNRRFKV